MDAYVWLWIALIVFCCIPMLFMGKRDNRSHDAAKENDGKSGK